MRWKSSLPSHVTSEMEAPGSAYIFHYPFDIFVSAELQGLYEVPVGERTLRIYPPFAGSDAGQIWVPDVPVARFPFPPATRPPVEDNAVVADLKLDRNLGNPSDSLRIDFYPPVDDRTASEAAERLIGIIRWWTGQWWVKRDRRHAQAPLHNQFLIAQNGERISGVTKYASLYGFLGFERTLDRRAWEAVIQRFVDGREVPLGRDIYLDAVYFHATGDLRRAILETAIANELMLDEQAREAMAQHRLSAGRLVRAFEGNDYLKHLERVGRLFGRSFSKEDPTNYHWIRAMWVARGHVAHGKVPRIPAESGSRDFLLEDMIPIFSAVGALVRWLEALGGAPQPAPAV